MPTNSTNWNRYVDVQCFPLRNRYILHSYHLYVHYVIIFLFAMLILPAFILNLGFIKALMNRRILRLPSNIYILNTNIIDMVSSVILLPTACAHHITILLSGQQHCPLYYVTVLLSYMCTWVSFLMVFAVTLERYLKVSRPFSPHWSIRTRLVVCVALWVFSLAVVLGSLFINGFSIFNILSCTLGPLIVITSIFLHTKLAMITKRAQRVIRSQSIVVSTAEGCGQQQNYILTRKERKTNRLTLFMLFSLVVCYLPYCATLAIWFLSPVTYDYTSFNASMVFVVSKILINPLIYWYHMPMLRKNVKSFLLCKKYLV